MKYFDFIFYRLANKLSGIKNSHNAAIALVSLIQVAIIFYPVMSFAIWSMRFNGSEFIKIEYLYYIGMSIAICVFILNNVRYETQMIKRLRTVEAMTQKLSQRTLFILDSLIIIVLAMVILYAPLFLLMTGATFKTSVNL